MNNYKWCIVVPYRDRAHHLAVFIPYYNSLFPGVPVYVVEQADAKPFNRAKLANCWAKEALQYFDYFIFHDCDMFISPEHTGNYFSYPKQPTGLATECSQFKYKMPYPEYFGGVSSISAEAFNAINGASNEFWSRNGEDDSIYRELVKAGYKPEWKQTRYECFEHPRDLHPTLFKKNLELLAKGKDPDDGLSSCIYNVISIEIQNGYIHIKVEL